MLISSVLGSVVDKAFGRVRRLPVSNSVLLTFDDGPHPTVTPAVLDRLRKFNARAVFFVVGSRIPLAPQMLPRIVAEGHAVGNHTFEHRLERDPWLLPYYFDVRRCQAALAELTGEAPRLFRAPMGRSTAGALITPRLLGLRQVLWSADSDDWKLRSEEGAVECGRRLCATTKPGDIVLLHDDNPWTPTVLDILLPHLVQKRIDISAAVDNI